MCGILMHAYVYGCLCLAYRTINEILTQVYIDDQEMWGCNEETINCLSAIQLAMTFVIKHFKRIAIKPNQNSLHTERLIERGED